DYAVTIMPSADLSISALGAPDPVAVGSNLTFTITVSNGGPSTATGVFLSNTLPATVNFISAAASQGSCTPNGARVICDLGSLNNAATALFTLVVVPRIGGGVGRAAEAAGSTFDLVRANTPARALFPAKAPPVVTMPPQSQTATNGNDVT